MERREYCVLDRVRSTKGLLGTYGSRRALQHGIHFHSSVVLYLKEEKND
jgi:hypothetical protein